VIDSRPSDMMAVSDGTTRRYLLQNAVECSDWNSVSPMNIPIARPRPQQRARALQTTNSHGYTQWLKCNMTRGNTVPSPLRL